MRKRSARKIETGPDTSRSGAQYQRVRFVAPSAAGKSPLVIFGEPWLMCAVAENSPNGEVPKGTQGPDATAELTILLLSASGTPNAERLRNEFLENTGESNVPATVHIRSGNKRVSWRPGRAVIQAPPDDWDQLTSAIVSFAFFEGRLRRLERDLLEQHATAVADPAAHHVDTANRATRERFARTIERFTTARLEYGQLEPRLIQSPRHLSAGVRQLYERLLERSECEDRLEAASNQLENYEYLYEDANDRLSDHRWYQRGIILEVLIVVLLVVEVVLISIEIMTRTVE